MSAGTMQPIDYKDIPGLPGYRVGTDGSVWSRWKRGFGRGPAMTDRWWLLKPYLSSSGYPAITPRSTEVKRRPYLVHRLVLEAFVGPCPDGMECCHNDGNPQNNRLDNLRWDTRKANHDDQARHGTRVRGERHPMAKLTPVRIEAIFALRQSGWTLDKISAVVGVSLSRVGKLLKKHSWQHSPSAGKDNRS